MLLVGKDFIGYILQLKPFSLFQIILKLFSVYQKINDHQFVTRLHYIVLLAIDEQKKQCYYVVTIITSLVTKIRKVFLESNKRI